MNQLVSLSSLAPGRRGRVSALDVTGAMRRRLLDLGLIAGTEVACVGRSPAGDPAAYLIRGAVIAIRAQDAARIWLRPMEGEGQHGPD